MNRLNLVSSLTIMTFAMIPAFSAISSTHAQSFDKVTPSLNELAPAQRIPVEIEEYEEFEDSQQLRNIFSRRKKDCFATFSSNGVVTYEIKLGQVNGLNRRQECLDLGITYANNSLDFRVFNFGYTGQQVCDLGGRVPIHVNTRVEDLDGSRDGNTTSSLRVTCQTNCRSTYIP